MHYSFLGVFQFVGGLGQGNFVSLPNPPTKRNTPAVARICSEEFLDETITAKFA
jgi:hypothetical protein